MECCDSNTPNAVLPLTQKSPAASPLATPQGLDDRSTAAATGLRAGVAQVSDEFVQLGFERVEFVLFGSQLPLSLDFCRLRLLRCVRRGFEFGFSEADPLLQFFLLRQVFFRA
jgi:hypothetical protein